MTQADWILLPAFSRPTSDPWPDPCVARRERSDDRFVSDSGCYICRDSGTVTSIKLESAFVADDLAVQLSDLVLLTRGQWLGRGKSLPRVLRACDRAFADQLFQALEDVHLKQSIDAMDRIAREVLAPFGGELFAGYRLGGD